MTIPSSPFQNPFKQGSSPSAIAPLTEEDIRQAVPSHLRASVNQNMADILNNLTNDPLTAEAIRHNFVSYTIILREGRFKIEDYISAVAYVSYKLMSYNNEEAYARTFPKRYNTLVANGISKKDISAYVAAYSRGKLVNLIMEQTLVPSWVLNQDIYQRAINVQADLMVNSHSDKVRTDAANSLLNHLKKPETGNLTINLDKVESNGMKEMKQMLLQLAEQQKSAIESGQAKTIDIAASRITQEAEDI